METYYCRFFRIALILFSASLAVVPSMVSADCGPAPNNGWGANYSSYAAWCTQCGGRPYNNNGVGCDMSGASSGSLYKAPAVGGVGGVKGAILQGIQSGIQQGIQQGIQNAIQQRQREEAEQLQRQQMENDRAAQQMLQDSGAIEKDAREKARLIEEKNRISSTKAKQTDVQRTNEILSQMRGGFNTSPQSQLIQETQGVSLRPKDLSKAPDFETEKCVRETDFKEYEKRESERKEVLGRLSGYPVDNQIMKARADWCKMHIPLHPSPSSTGYCRQKPVYEARMNDWQRRCTVVIEAPAQSPPTSVLPEKESQRMPAPAPDCLGVYDGEANSCGTEDLILYAKCTNKALQSFVNCMNFYDPDKGTSAPKPVIPIR